MRKIFTTILIVTILMLLVGCDKPEETITEQDIEAEREALYNTAEASDSYVIIDAEHYTEKVEVSVPARADYDTDEAFDAAVKEEAYELFKLANRNDQNCLRRLAYTQNLVTTVGVEAKNLVIDLKNGEEYLKYDFQPVVKKLGITVDGHGKATYTRLGLDSAYYVEVGDSVINDDWTGYADFGGAEGTLTTRTDMLYFHASQRQAYCVTEAVVNAGTIQHATLTHNDAEGYYTIVFELDPKATGAARYLLPSLRNNSGMSNAKYTSITETIEIWDNGFFKRFLSVDKWSGTKVVTISSVINFDTVYYYDAESCRLSRYCNGYYDDIRRLAEAANAAKAQ